jgi:hypothetical protein
MQGETTLYSRELGIFMAGSAFAASVAAMIDIVNFWIVLKLQFRLFLFGRNQQFGLIKWDDISVDRWLSLG